MLRSGIKHYFTSVISSAESAEVNAKIALISTNMCWVNKESLYKSLNTGLK